VKIKEMAERNKKEGETALGARRARSDITEIVDTRVHAALLKQ